MARSRPRNRREATVAAVLVVKDPDVEHLVWTLDALSEQDYPIEEVIIVDSSATPLEANVDDIETRIIHAPETGIAAARKLGARESTADYIIDMDEDAVLMRPDYVSQAIELLEHDPRTVAAGGVVLPIRDNREGHAIALADRYNPSALGTHNMVYPRAVCSADAEEMCFPMENRGEDVTIRKRLMDFGEIRRMNDQVVLKDLPTTRQTDARNTVLWTVLGGALTSIATEIVRASINRATGGTLRKLTTAS